MNGFPAHPAAASGTQRRALERYVGVLKAALGLVSWNVTVSWTEWADETTDAQVVPVDGRHLATVFLGPGFGTLDFEEQREVLVHELLHLHTAPMVYGVEEAFKLLPDKAGQLASAQFSRHEEYAVDAIAASVAVLLPLPPWADSTPDS